MEDDDTSQRIEKNQKIEEFIDDTPHNIMMGHQGVVLPIPDKIQSTRVVHVTPGEEIKEENHSNTSMYSYGAIKVKNKPNIGKSLFSICCSIRTIFPAILIGGMLTIATVVWTLGFTVSFLGIQSLGNTLGESASNQAVTKVEFLLDQASSQNEQCVTFYERFVKLQPLLQKNESVTAQQEENIYEFMLSLFLYNREQYSSYNILFNNGDLLGIEITNVLSVGDDILWNRNVDGTNLVIYTQNWRTGVRKSNFTVPVNAHVIPTLAPALTANMSESMFFGVSPHVVFSTPVTSAARVIRDKYGNPFATANVVIRFDQLHTLMKEINPVEDGFMAFIDDQGIIGATTLTKVSEVDYTKSCREATSVGIIKVLCDNIVSNGGFSAGKSFKFFYGATEYQCSVAKIEKPGHSYGVYSIIPSVHFTKNLLISTGVTFGVSGFIIIIFIVISLIISMSFVSHLRTLSKSFKDIERLNLNSGNVKKTERLKTVVFEVHSLRDNFKRMKNALAAFTQFVPAPVVQSFFHQGLQDNMAERYVTVIFLDIRNFTNIVEQMDPQMLVNKLTSVFTMITEKINKHEGVIVNYIGDAILAIVNAPNEVYDHEYKACLSAIEAVSNLDAFPEFSCRVGIHAGICHVGIYGSRSKKQFTCLGNTPNVASRLEGLNKHYRTDIIISETVQKKLAGRLPTRQIDRIRVKGKTEAITVHELRSDFDWDENDANLYNESLMAFKSGDFEHSHSLLSRIRSRDDLVEFKTSQSLDFAEKKASNSLEDFDGVITMTEK